MFMNKKTVWSLFLLMVCATSALASIPDTIPITDSLFITPSSPAFNVELPECISKETVSLPVSMEEAFLNGNTVEISEIVHSDDGDSRIAVQKTILAYTMLRSPRELNPYVAVRFPAFTAKVEDGQSALALLPLPSEIVSRGLGVRDVAVIKIRSKSAGDSLFYDPIFEFSGLYAENRTDEGELLSITPEDGVFAVLKSDKKTFLQENERLVQGNEYFILLSVKDGGQFDSSNIKGVVSDPVFLSEYTATGGTGGGGCSTGYSPFAVLLLTPILAALRKKR